jgi:hypothetical protein
VQVLNLYLMPNTRTWDLTAETWDLKLIMPAAFIPVSGFPLSAPNLPPATRSCHRPPENGFATAMS